MTAVSNAAAAQTGGDAAGGSVRVMIVDDSAVIRGLLRRTLETDSEIQVVKTVPNGKLAVDAVKAEPIDVVVLDIEMPVMTGLEALPLIIKAAPETKVIMASTLTRRGAAISLEALQKGAADFVPKPTASRDLDAANDFGRELISKVKTLGATARSRVPGAAPRTGSPANARPGAPAASAPTASTGKIYGQAPIALRKPSSVPPRILAIGSSTGGPQALQTVLAALKPIKTVPIVVTQHMPATFTTILAEHLSRSTQRECREAVDGETLVAGRLYLAPGDFHMTLRSEGTAVKAVIDQNPPENFCRPAVDPLFRSVAEVFGPASLAVVLTGMGQDGLIGGQSIVEAGGTVLAQDEATSVVWGMPGAVATNGVCSAVLPVTDIPGHVLKIFGAGA